MAAEEVLMPMMRKCRIESAEKSLVDDIEAKLHMKQSVERLLRSTVHLIPPESKP
jgi:hypothetical protein